MISGWAGTAILDSAMEMPVPERKLYLRAGGRPLVNITSLIVPFPTRAIEERQLVTMREGSDAIGDYGWEIEFKRNDAYGSAIVEMNELEDVPLSIEHCPDVTNEVADTTSVIPVTTFETSQPTLTFTSEPACGVLAVIEEELC